MKVGSLKDVEAWSGGGGYLGIGTHPAEITSASEGESSGGHPQFELEWSAISGEQKDATIKEWIVVIASTKGKLKGLLEACGVEITDSLDEVNPSDLQGLQANIVVRKENPDDKYPKVMGHLPLSDLPAPDMDGLGADPVDEPSLPF